MTSPLLADLIHVPAGRVIMCGTDNPPETVIDVPAFAIARTPVTAEEFCRFVQIGGAKPRATWGGLTPPRGCEDHPVTGCSWQDASAYCRWLSDQTGERFYLPSEAEWERAAKGDTQSIWPWGDKFDPRKANTCEAANQSTTPVAAHPEGASVWGVLDMAGNVWEWTRDLFQPYPYQPTHLDHMPPLTVSMSEDRRRVLRGGSWMANAPLARCSARTAWYPSVIFSGQVGFRVACQIPTTESAS
jgi:toxoflavin biosynthesis protein ToxD